MCDVGIIYRAKAALKTGCFVLQIFMYVCVFKGLIIKIPNLLLKNA